MKNSVYWYIQGALGDENIFAVTCVTLLRALHIVIKQQFFNIYLVCNGHTLWYVFRFRNNSFIILSWYFVNLL